MYFILRYYFNYVLVRLVFHFFYLWGHPFIHQSNHLFIYSSIHSSVQSFIHPFIHQSNHLFIYSSIHSSVQSFIHLFIHSFISPIIYSIIHSFVEICKVLCVENVWSNVITAKFWWKLNPLCLLAFVHFSLKPSSLPFFSVTQQLIPWHETEMFHFKSSRKTIKSLVKCSVVIYVIAEWLLSWQSVTHCVIYAGKLIDENVLEFQLRHHFCIWPPQPCPHVYTDCASLLYFHPHSVWTS